MRLFKPSLMVPLLILMIALATPAVSAEVDTVAKVGNVPITIYEVSRELQKLIPLSGTYHGGVSKEKIDELKEKALQTLIERAYMIQYAFDNELSVSRSEVDAVIDPVAARFKTREEFEKAAGPEGVEGLRASAFRQLLANKAQQVAVDDKIKIDEKALQADFEKNKHRYKRPRQFEASHILISVRPEMTAEEKDEKKQLAQSLYEKAVAGEDFYDLAYYNSDDKSKMVGGALPPFHLGQSQPEVEEVLLTMQPGEVSKPIRTFYGYEIVQLKKDTPETQLTFDDMREKLVGNIRKLQHDELKNAWLDGLKAKYKVERYDSK